MFRLAKAVQSSALSFALAALFGVVGLSTGCGPGEANPPENLRFKLNGQVGATEVKATHLYLKSDCPNEVARLELEVLSGTGLDWTADWAPLSDSYGEQWALNKSAGLLAPEGPELLVLNYRCQPEESAENRLWLTFSQSGSEVGTVAIDVDVQVAE
jgi:hypothetical protein